MVEILGTQGSCSKCGKSADEVGACEDCNGMTFVTTFKSSALRLLENLSELAAKHKRHAAPNTGSHVLKSSVWCAVCDVAHPPGEHIEGGGNRGNYNSRKKDQKENGRPHRKKRF